MRGRRVESPSIRCNGDGATQIMITILVVILLLVALGALPTWPYSRGWGYYPSSGLGLVVLVLVILLLLGRL
jgi:membrane protein YdbS with pleckstrin-like domain